MVPDGLCLLWYLQRSTILCVHIIVAFSKPEAVDNDDFFELCVIGDLFTVNRMLGDGMPAVH